MRTSWRIVEEVIDGDVKLAHIQSPAVLAEESIVTYDYSGNHLENVSTYPGQSRLVTATYDPSSTSWYLRSTYASDAMLTNRIVAKEGIQRTIPLFLSFTSSSPLLSNTSEYNGTYITNRAKLLSEITLLTEFGTELNANSFLHDIEFIPYHVHMGVPYEVGNSALFFVKVYSNGTLDGSTVKIRFRALEMTTPGGEQVGDHTEYLSFEQTHNLFNTSYEFKEGVGSDLIGNAYPGSTLNPLYSMDPNSTIPLDPDKDRGRKQGEYSLMYSYAENNYQAMLTDKYKEEHEYMAKPAPLFLVYYKGVLDDITPTDHINIEYDGANIVLVLTEPGDSPREFRFSMNGRASYDVTFEINNSSAPFTCYEGIRVEEITSDTLYNDSTSLYSATGTTAQVYDLTADNGMIIRSTKYIAKYTPEPTITAVRPATKSARVSWAPRVKVGGFADANGVVFYVKEYGSQQWSRSKGFPYVDVIGEEAVFTSPIKIKTAYPLLFNDYQQITLTDGSGADVTHMIDGINALEGIIFLKQTIKSSRVYINYTYKEYYYEVDSANLNPVAPHNAKVGSYYVISVAPHIPGESVSTTNVDILDDLPNTNYIEDSMILAAFLIIDEYTIKDDYKLVNTGVFGGGIKKSLTSAQLDAKIPNREGLTDLGYLDGIRFPANCVVHYSLPSFLSGNDSIVLATYNPEVGNPVEIKIFGASNIPPGTLLLIHYSELGLPPEEAVVQGTISHDTIRLVAPLINSVSIGAKVKFPTPVKALFSQEDIGGFIKKFSTIATYPIIEYS